MLQAHTPVTPARQPESVMSGPQPSAPMWSYQTSGSSAFLKAIIMLKLSSPVQPSALPASDVPLDQM